MKPPGITLITPTIPGREALLAECVASVEAQTLWPTEHVIVLDETGEGPAVIRTRAGLAADTEWLAFVDDDDLLWPNHLETLYDNRVGADVVYGLFDVLGPNSWPNSEPPHFCHPWLLERTNWIPVTVLVSQAMFAKVGGFPAVHLREDWALWKAMNRAGAGFKCIHEKTWTYRLHGNNRTVLHDA